MAARSGWWNHQARGLSRPGQVSESVCDPAVVHYLDGLTRSLTKGAEDAGEATGERIKKSLRRFFSGHSDVTRDEAVEAVADASRRFARRPIGGLGCHAYGAWTR